MMRLDLRQILKIYPAYQGLTAYPHRCCIFVRRLDSLGNCRPLWVTNGRLCANSGCVQKQYLNHPLVPIYHLPRFASLPFLRTGKIGWTPNWWILMPSPQRIHLEMSLPNISTDCNWPQRNPPIQWCQQYGAAPEKQVYLAFCFVSIGKRSIQGPDVTGKVIWSALSPSLILFWHHTCK